MLIRNSNGLRWPAALLCTALIVYGSAFVLVRWYDSRALTLPIDLKPGITRSPEFRVDQKVNYLVELEVERNIPFEKLNCLLGHSISRIPCSVKSVVDLQWALMTGSREVATGNSLDQKGGGWGPTITRGLGRFEGSPRTSYILQVTTSMDGSALAPANPRIVVQVHPSEYKTRVASAQLMVMAAMAIAGIGVIWLIFWTVRTYAASRKT